MPRKVVVLLVLACASRGRRVRTSGKQARRSPVFDFANGGARRVDSVEALAALLQVRDPAAAFSPSGPGAELSSLIRRAYSLPLQKRMGSHVSNIYVSQELTTSQLDGRPNLGSTQPIVFDDVFSSSACHYLHTGSSLGELGYEEHTLFKRDSPPATALEMCIESVLHELGDKSPYVEYWWRDTWEHVKAHEDVDENLFERDEIQRRYPTHAHVLYLKVGAAVRGPTCVWGHGDDNAKEYSDFGSLTITPAREGRLLRFDGKLMHSVPRPADMFLPPEWRAPRERHKRKKDDLVRSVLLFNTWDEPPFSVPGAENLDDPHEVVSRLAGDFSSPSIDALIKVMANPDADCQPFNKWVQAPQQHAASSQILQAEDGTPVPMHVELLGEAERRGQRDRVLKFDAPHGLFEALHEGKRVTYFQ